MLFSICGGTLHPSLATNMTLGRYFALAAVLQATVGREDVSLPLTYSTPGGSSQAVCNDTVFTLSSNGTSPSVIILDYGRDVEGYGTYHVSRRSGNTSGFEMSYSETRALLDTYMVSQDGSVFWLVCGGLLTSLVRRTSSPGCCHGHLSHRPVQH